MSTASSDIGQSERIDGKRLLWVAPLTILLAVVINVIIRLIAVYILGIGEGFPPLSVAPPIFFTAIGVLGGVIVFSIVTRVATRPIHTFRIIALVVLVISFIPDILLLLNSSMPGTTPAAVLILMAMHIAAGALCVGFLPAQSRAR